MPWRKPPEPPLDPFERAARRVDPDYAQLAEAADAVPPKSLRSLRLLLGFALVVGLVAISQSGRGGTDLQRSCATPAAQVTPTSASYDAPITWAAAGPASLRVVLALDSSSVPSAPLAGPVPLQDCLARGSFPLQARTGRHTLSLFFLAPDGSVTKVLTRSLTVE